MNRIFKVEARGKPIKRLPSQILVSSQDSTNTLYEKISSTGGYSINRLRVSRVSDGTLSVPNDRNVTIEAADIQGNSTIYVKDLGPQLDWRTVYILEYIGPLIIHPLLLHYRLQDSTPTPAQILTFYLVILHFAKRELESIFIHRFSNATMPARNLFKNSGHYWLLSGVLLSWFVYAPLPNTHSEHPTTMPPALPHLTTLPLTTYLGLTLWLLGATLNTYVHWIQRNLRPPGTTVRKVPHGPGFAWVTCPNYFFETLAWIGVFFVNLHWATVVFILGSVAQMKVWADKKEKRYRREFPGEYVPKRYGVLPGIC